ncbi:MAG: hypothetical protein ACK46L_03080 [Synechococcaceae cyanobacterium]|jgi:hypothetical protein
MILFISQAHWSSPPLHGQPPAPLQVQRQRHPPVERPASLLVQLDRGSSDRSRRFPLRREGGGTRGACASRLVAHLVPQDGRLDPGVRPIFGVIEGESPEPAPLVLRWAGGERIEPARSGASLRLLLLSAPVSEGLWESFPACEGNAEPMAPPARSLLAPAAGSAAADRAARRELDSLWRRCGERVATAELLASWSYLHLADRLPSTLPVICVAPSPSGG